MTYITISCHSDIEQTVKGNVKYFLYQTIISYNEDLREHRRKISESLLNCFSKLCLYPLLRFKFYVQVQNLNIKDKYTHSYRYTCVRACTHTHKCICIFQRLPVLMEMSQYPQVELKLKITEKYRGPRLCDKIFLLE